MSNWIKPHLVDWLKQVRIDANKYRRLVDEFNNEFEDAISIIYELENVVYQLDEMISELEEDAE